MNDQGTQTTLVRKMRTFAEDVRRAREQNGAPPQATPIQTLVPKASKVPEHQPLVEQEAVAVAASAPARRVPLTATVVPQESSVVALPPIKKPSFDPPVTLYPVVAGEQSGHQEAVLGAPEGTIIRDTRGRRWKLGDALGGLISTWVRGQKGAVTEIAQKEGPAPNVPPANVRTQAVEAARQKSMLTPQDDRYDTIARMRTFASDAARVTGKPYATVDWGRGQVASQWSPAERENPSRPDRGTAETFDSLEEAPYPIKQARKTIRPLETLLPPFIGDMPAQEAKSLTKDVAPVAQQPLPEDTFAPQEKKAAAMEHLLVIRKRHVLERAEPKEPSQAHSRDIAFVPPTSATQKTASVRTYRNDAIQEVKGNERSVPDIAAAQARRAEAKSAAHRPMAPASPARPFVLAGIMMIVILLVGGAAGFFWYSQRGTREDTTVARIPTFIAIDAQKAAPFSNNRATLLQTLSDEVKTAGSGLTQIYPTPAEEGGGAGTVAVPTSDFMRTLDPRAPGSFIRNLENGMMFGAHNGSNPFFIFKIAQFDTAFAGMLDWEPYLSADLAPLFGEPAGETAFVDDTIRNVDVRILYDEDGTERILYVFPNKNTIVITTSSSALTALIERLR